MENSDLVRLRHMLDSAEAILDFTKGKRRTSLNTNKLLLPAVLRQFEVLGEAAGKISPKIRKQFSGVPWVKLVGMRNRLIHAYFDVDRDIIWKTIREYLPKLRKELVEILKSIDSK